MSSGNGGVDYSDYAKHLSNMGGMYSFLSGFMFTAITVLITRLPDPSSAIAQFALFFMAVMLDIFIFYMGDLYMSVLNLCKNVPPSSGKRSFYNVLSDVCVMLGLGGSTVLLFLLFNFVYLALAQMVAWLLMILVAYRTIFAPYYAKNKHKKQIKTLGAVSAHTAAD